MIFDGCGGIKGLVRKAFDLLHNSHPGVPLYTDGCELLVLTALLTSALKLCVFQRNFPVQRLGHQQHYQGENT